MLLVLVPVTGSGEGVLVLHRMVPTCALQAIVAGIGAYALASWVVPRGRWRPVAAVPGTIIAFSVLLKNWSALTMPYVFTEEYQLVRSHLAPDGIVARDCTLMTFNSNPSSIPASDVDLHDFRQVVPGMRVLDCRSTDCVAAASNGGCFYVVASITFAQRLPTSTPLVSHPRVAVWQEMVSLA